MPRCFVAINPPPEIANAIGETQAVFRRELLSGHSLRWTQPIQFHLTLKFLGEVEADQLEKLSEA